MGNSEGANKINEDRLTMKTIISAYFGINFHLPLNHLYLNAKMVKTTP